MSEPAKDSVKVRKQLSLTEHSVAQGEALKTALNRPSLSNVVEALISEEHKRQFPPVKTQPQPEERKEAA